MSWEPRLVWGGHFCGHSQFRVHVYCALFQAFLKRGCVTSEHSAAKCIEVIFFVVARLDDLGQVLFLRYYSLSWYCIPSMQLGKRCFGLEIQCSRWQLVGTVEYRIEGKTLSYILSIELLLMENKSLLTNFRWSRVSLSFLLATCNLFNWNRSGIDCLP